MGDIVRGVADRSGPYHFNDDFCVSHSILPQYYTLI